MLHRSVMTCLAHFCLSSLLLAADPTAPQAAAQALGGQNPLSAGAATDPFHPRARIETTLGDIVIELDVKSAPSTVLNFVDYCEAGEYDGTIFHRVKGDSVIQGGAFNADMTRRRRSVPPAVSDTWHIDLESLRGAVALIRQTDRDPDHTTEFFINLRDNTHHDVGTNHGRFATFAKVVGGLDTIERIRSTPVGTNPKYAYGYSPVVPKTPVVIKSIRLVTPFDRALAMKVIEAHTPDPVAALTKLYGEEVVAKRVETPSGIIYVDVRPGRGPRAPSPDDVVEFQYRGMFLDGAEFETTYTKAPAMRKVGSLIPGLREMLTTMTEGCLRAAVIPPNLAYGDGGIPGIIPSGATVIYEMDLLEIR